MTTAVRVIGGAETEETEWDGNQPVYSSSIDRGFEFINYPPSTSPPTYDAFPLDDVRLRKSNIDCSDTDLAAFRTVPLSAAKFESMFDSSGRIIDEHVFRRCIFRGGIDAALRPKAWCFLFGVFECHSTESERGVILSQLKARYEALKSRWQLTLKQSYPSFDFTRPDNFVLATKPFYELEQVAAEELSPSDGSAALNARHGARKPSLSKVVDFHSLEAQAFVRRVPCDMQIVAGALRHVSKDVLRTERSHDLFRDPDSTNLICMRDMLVTFAVFRPDVGYVQGMNDILCRFFCVFQSEVLAFWCFVCYVDKVQKDFLALGMVRKIDLLKSLVEELDPDLFHYLKTCHSDDLVFCHKWLLLCFLREFSFNDGFTLFEIVSTQHLEMNSEQARTIRQHACRQLNASSASSGVRLTAAEEVIDSEYTFDLFVCIAILEIHREKMFACTDSSQVFCCVTDLSGKLDLGEVLTVAEKLFYRFCKRSLLDCFVLT